MKRKKFVPPLKNPPAAKDTDTASSNKTEEKNTKVNTPTSVLKDTTTTTSTTTSSTKKKFKPPTVVNPNSLKETKTSKSKTTNSKSTSTPTSTSNNSEDDPDEDFDVWAVMQTKNTNKKHKTYEDGVLLIKKRRYILYDTQGKQLLNRLEAKVLDNLKEEDEIILGSKLCLLHQKISKDDYISGRVFLRYQTNTSTTTSTEKKKSSSTKVDTKFKAHSSAKNTTGLGTNNNANPVIKAPEGYIIINENHPEKDENGNEISDVYIDSFLAEHLRPHQIEGVRFMYECVMGLRNFQGNGCLLADEMGLGKTLQSITLLYTLMRRGPYGKPILKKAIVVTNSSLVNNWSSEFKKWLGDEKLSVATVGSKTAKTSPADTIRAFKAGHAKVLIISYNLCSNYVGELVQCKCDLLICDEGHKLKNSNIKIFQSLRKVSTARRIALSGTPLQNQLGEFFTICDFINPGLLGDATSFRNLFTDPISLSREPSATPKEKKVGEARSKELAAMTSQFVLRRTNDILAKHLPPKMELVLFCGMTPLQEKLYKHFILSKEVKSNIDSSNALAFILNLKRLLTHPNMVDLSGHDDEDKLSDAWKGSDKLFDDYEFDPQSEEYHAEFSGKMIVLENLLKHIKEEGDRVVIVSNYTSILNEIQRLLKQNDHTYVRLDGSTQSEKRMKIVDSFNNKNSKDFIFLLSSKAGGCGLNLIGANRLIMFDPDWNPSTDLQAMARVWRDGQKKNVFIYRFIGCGTIEEKIFQRQIVKTGLSKSTLDEKSSKSQFTNDFLKELFKYENCKECKTFTVDENEVETIGEKDNVLGKVLEENEGLIPFVKVMKDLDGLKINDDGEVKDDEEEEDNQSKDEDIEMVDKEEGEEEFKFEENSDTEQVVDSDIESANSDSEDEKDCKKRKCK
ncbi:hypothetical protein ABK040_001224 [Willaertia magna]